MGTGESVKFVGWLEDEEIMGIWRRASVGRVCGLDAAV